MFNNYNNNSNNNGVFNFYNNFENLMDKNPIMQHDNMPFMQNMFPMVHPTSMIMMNMMKNMMQLNNLNFMNNQLQNNFPSFNIGFNNVMNNVNNLNNNYQNFVRNNNNNFIIQGLDNIKNKIEPPKNFWQLLCKICQNEFTNSELNQLGLDSNKIQEFIRLTLKEKYNSNNPSKNIVSLLKVIGHKASITLDATTSPQMMIDSNKYEKFLKTGRLEFEMSYGKKYSFSLTKDGFVIEYVNSDKVHTIDYYGNTKQNAFITDQKNSDKYGKFLFQEKAVDYLNKNIYGKNNNCAFEFKNGEFIKGNLNNMQEIFGTEKNVEDFLNNDFLKLKIYDRRFMYEDFFEDFNKNVGDIFNNYSYTYNDGNETLTFDKVDLSLHALDQALNDSSTSANFNSNFINAIKIQISSDSIFTTESDPLKKAILFARFIAITGDSFSLNNDYEKNLVDSAKLVLGKIYKSINGSEYEKVQALLSLNQLINTFSCILANDKYYEQFENVNKDMENILKNLSDKIINRYRLESKVKSRLNFERKLNIEKRNNKVEEKKSAIFEKFQKFVTKIVSKYNIISNDEKEIVSNFISYYMGFCIENEKKQKELNMGENYFQKKYELTNFQTHYANQMLYKIHNMRKKNLLSPCLVIASNILHSNNDIVNNIKNHLGGETYSKYLSALFTTFSVVSNRKDSFNILMHNLETSHPWKKAFPYASLNIKHNTNSNLI